MIAQNLIIIARNIKSIAVEDCDGDYYPREIRVSDYYYPSNMDIFRFLNNQSI